MGVAPVIPLINYDHFGDVITTVGTKEFGTSFYGLCRDALAIEECTVFCFPLSAQPSKLVIEAESTCARERADGLANQYVLGDYLDDPVVHRYLGQASNSVYVLDPCDVDNQSYRERYYDGPSICQEMGVVGQVDDRRYLVTFARKSREAAFTRRDIDNLTNLTGFIFKAIRRHDALSELQSDARRANPVIDLSAPDRREDSIAYLRDLLFNSDQRLSRREAEICSRIALGYSALAISLHFNISTNTIATHRKRAYAKLNISSQNELFSRYFSITSEAARTH